jgi:EmrB/QacA subfamily drug resistance transporter
MGLFTKNRRGWVALNVSLGVYMSTLDASIVNISLPTITQSFESPLKVVAWVVTAYLIVITGCLLIMGRLSDLFGQRRVYLIGFSAFTLGSALCGLSPSIYSLIGARIVQGLGASALMASGPAILTTAFPEEKRGQALGLIGSVVSAGFLTGPILGGFMVEHLGWRSVFFINLPIGLIGIFLSSKVLEEGAALKKAALDLWGALLIFILITSLLFFLNQVSQGSNPLLWGWLLLGLACSGLLAFVELRSPSPLVDLHLFKKRLFVVSLGTSLLAFWMSAAHAFVLPFFLQGILKYSPSRVGMLIFPVSLTVMLMAPLGGRVSDRMGVRIPATVGLLLLTLAIFSFSFIRAGESDFSILWRQVLLGIGIALFNPANNSAIIGSLPKEKVGLASSFMALSRNLGMVVGIAFTEMVVALRTTTLSLEPGKGTLSFVSLQDVWRSVLLIGLVGILLSWTRGKRFLREGQEGLSSP